MSNHTKHKNLGTDAQTQTAMVQTEQMKTLVEFWKKMTHKS